MNRRGFLKASLYATAGLFSQFIRPGVVHPDTLPPLTQRAYLPLVGSRSVTTWFIDAVSGSDSTGTGATGAPYKTLTKALSVYANGDTIKVRGTAANPYREADLTLWGKTGATIQNDTGHTPRFVLSLAYTSWAKTGGRTNVYQCANATGYTYGVWNGVTLLTNAGSVAACDAATNSYYLDTGANLLYVNIGGGAPASIESVNNYTGLFNSAGDGLTVSGIEIAYGSAGFLYLNSGNNHRITNVTCSLIGNSGGTNGMIQLTGAGCIIDNAHFPGLINASVAAIAIAGTNNTVQNCVIQCALAVNSNVASIIQVLSGTGHTIQDCEVSQGVDGISISGGASCTVLRCKSHDNGHAQFIAAAAGVVAFRFCQAYLTYDIYGGGTGTGSNGNGWGFVCENGSVGTYYQCTSANLLRSTKAGNRGGFYALLASAAMTVKDCIAYNCENGYDVDPATATMVNDYNCAFLNNSNYAGATPGAHDITSDPLFVSSAGNDYHLQAGSPCLSAGIAIAGVNDPPLVQPPDLGAYVRTYVTPPGLPGALGGTITLLDTVNPPVKGYKGPTWPSMKRTTKTAGAAHVNPAGVVKVDVGFVGGKMEFPSLEFWELTAAQRDALIADLMANVVLYLVLPDRPGVYTCVFAGVAEDTADMHGDGTVVYAVKLTGLKVR